jgi:hypothetical protein
MDNRPQIIINIIPKNKLVKLDPLEEEEIKSPKLIRSSKLNKKLQIFLKPPYSNIEDNISLTNKNIIFTFWYIILCYDINKGFVNIDEEYILDIEGSINIKKEHFLIDILKKLKKNWHKQINKININFSKIKKYYNPEQISKSVSDNSISNLTHYIVPIDIHFHLTKKIHRVNEFDVNGIFLHKLIMEEIKNLSLPIDNVTILSKYFPFNSEIDDIDDNGNELIYTNINISFSPLFKY